MSVWRNPVSLTLLLALPLAQAATPRWTSLAQFDNGYTQCEKRDPAMKGHRDEVYASLYRLKLDDDLRKQLDETRKSAPYKAERRRAQQALAKAAAASDVQRRLDQQCMALKNEINPVAAPASAAQR